MSARNEHGFTLIDVLVGTMLAVIICASAVSFVHGQSLAMRTQIGQTDVNDEARGVVEFMVREIRLAGYNPRCITTPPPVTALVTAEPQRLRIQYDLNENGVLNTGANDSEDVTYQYDTANKKIQRVVGDIATDLATDVGASGFALKYYQSNGTEIVGAGAGGALNAAQMAAVYRIALLFQPLKTPDTRVTGNVSSTLWTSVLLRNREYPCA